MCGTVHRNSRPRRAPSLNSNPTAIIAPYKGQRDEKKILIRIFGNDHAKSAIRAISVPFHSQGKTRGHEHRRGPLPCLLRYLRCATQALNLCKLHWQQHNLSYKLHLGQTLHEAHRGNRYTA